MIDWYFLLLGDVDDGLGGEKDVNFQSEGVRKQRLKVVHCEVEALRVPDKSRIDRLCSTCRIDRIAVFVCVFVVLC